MCVCVCVLPKVRYSQNWYDPFECPFNYSRASGGFLGGVDDTFHVPHPLRMRGLYYEHMGVGQNSTTRGPQVLVHVATYQGSILNTYS